MYITDVVNRKRCQTGQKQQQRAVGEGTACRHARCKRTPHVHKHLYAISACVSPPIAAIHCCPIRVGGIVYA